MLCTKLSRIVISLPRTSERNMPSELRVGPEPTLCLFNISLENPGLHCRQKTHAAVATRSLILSSYKFPETKHDHSGGTKNSATILTVN